MTIVKQEMSDWSGNDGEMTPHKKSGLRASNRPWDVDRGYLW